MNYRARLEAMVDDLGHHSLIEVVRSHLRPPLAATNPAQAKRNEASVKMRLKGRPVAQKMRRDPVLRAFYEEVDAFGLTWRLRREQLDPQLHAWALRCEEGDHQLEGHIELLNEGGAFDSQEHMIWLPEDDADDVLRTIQPFDRPTHAHRITVLVPARKGVELGLYHPSERTLASARLGFDAWFERLLATRGMLDTLWGSADGPDFARLRSVFPDVDPKLFA